jgi:type IV pilus biogenesis protein CpaD/CtpE
MIRSAIALTLAAPVIVACADGAADFGRPHPVALVTAREQLTVSVDGSRASNLQLRRSIDLIAEGNLQAVRAYIVAVSVAQARRVRELLIGMGLDPTRMTETIASSRHYTGASVILLRTTASPTDCAAAIAPAFPDDPTPSLSNLSRCVQDSNLAAMVVDPADLLAPPRLGPTDGAYLANGVRSWRGNSRTPLPAESTTGGINSGAATSAGTSSSPATTTNPNTRSQE